MTLPQNYLSVCPVYLPDLPVTTRRHILQLKMMKKINSVKPTTTAIN